MGAPSIQRLFGRPPCAPRAAAARAWARSAPRAPARGSRSGRPAPGRVASLAGAVAGTGARRVGGQATRRRAAASPTIAGADPAAARSMSGDEDHDRCRLAGSDVWWRPQRRGAHEVGALRPSLSGSGTVSPVSPGRRRRGPRRPPQTGQVVPFFAPSRPLAYPPVPFRTSGNYLSVFTMHCATIASCWRRLLSLRAPIKMTHSSRTAKSQQIRMHAKVRNA